VPGQAKDELSKTFEGLDKMDRRDRNGAAGRQAGRWLL